MIDELARDGIAYVPFFPLGGFSRLQSSTLSDVAMRLDATPMQVALAWLLQRSPNILLIPGTSSVAREVVLSRLLEVLFIEALRLTAETATSQGLARGLADPRIAHAIRAMHDQPAHAWTMADLAREATLSRSAFFERFKRTVGVAPMAYLLAWRMALAKQMLRQNERRIAEVAERVGYNSASAFSVAFTRSVGQSPAHYARASQ